MMMMTFMLSPSSSHPPPPPPLSPKTKWSSPESTTKTSSSPRSESVMRANETNGQRTKVYPPRLALPSKMESPDTSATTTSSSTTPTPYPLMTVSEKERYRSRFASSPSSPSSPLSPNPALTTARNEEFYLRIDEMIKKSIDTENGANEAETFHVDRRSDDAKHRSSSASTSPQSALALKENDTNQLPAVSHTTPTSQKATMVLPPPPPSPPPSLPPLPLAFIMGQSRELEKSGKQKMVASEGSFHQLLGWSCVKGQKPSHPSSPNQDTFFFLEFTKHHFVYCVCDGHGNEGHVISHAIQCFMHSYLEDFFDDWSPLYDRPEELKKFVSVAFHQCHTWLLKEYQEQSTWSGSTITLCFHFKEHRKLHICYLGDSRAALIQFGRPQLQQQQQRQQHHVETKNGASGLMVEASSHRNGLSTLFGGDPSRAASAVAPSSLSLSPQSSYSAAQSSTAFHILFETRDHSPGDPQERQRILSAGGQLTPQGQRLIYGICRLPVSSPSGLRQQNSTEATKHLSPASEVVDRGGGMYKRSKTTLCRPTLALSRALGDAAMQTLGMSIEPDIVSYTLPGPPSGTALRDSEMTPTHKHQKRTKRGLMLSSSSSSSSSAKSLFRKSSSNVSASSSGAAPHLITHCLVIASDGVWTPLSTVGVANILARKGLSRSNLQSLTNLLVKKAWTRWTAQTYIDDITLVLVDMTN